MDLTKIPTPHPQVAARTVDGSAVIVLADSGEVTVLNEVGTIVWELIDGRRSVQDLAAAVAAQYQISLDQAEQDVTAFLTTLIEASALTLADPPAPHRPSK